MDKSTELYMWLFLFYSGVSMMALFGLGFLPFNLYRWHKADGLYNLYKYLTKTFLTFILFVLGLILAMVAYSQIDYGIIGI